MNILKKNHLSNNIKKTTSEKQLETVTYNLRIETDNNKKNKHYVTMSSVSIGLAAARLLYLPFAVVSIIVFTYVAIPYLR